MRVEHLKWLSGLASLCLAAAPLGASAQTEDFLKPTMMGRAIASQHGERHLRPTNPVLAPGVAALQFRSDEILLPDSRPLHPLARPGPLRESDGAASELITPVTGNCSGSAQPCTITADFQHAHTDRFLIERGTGRSQEATDGLSPAGGIVLLTPEWSDPSRQALRLVIGAAATGIEDDRRPSPRWYRWASGSYQPYGPAQTLAVASFAGATLAAQATACIAALPPGGGVCDARGITGTVTSPGFSIARTNVELRFGSVVLTLTSAIEIDANDVTLAGEGPGLTRLVNGATDAGHCGLYPGLSGDDVIRSSKCSSSARFTGTVIEDLEIDGNRISTTNPGGVPPNVGASPVAIQAIARAGGVVTVTLSGSLPGGFSVEEPAAIAGVSAASGTFNGIYPIASVSGGNHFTYVQSGPDESGSGGEAGVYNDITQNGYNGTADSGTTLRNVYIHDSYGFGGVINGNGGAGSANNQIIDSTSSDNGETGWGLEVTTASEILGGAANGNGENTTLSPAIQIGAACNGCTAFSHGNSIENVRLSGNLGGGIDLVDTTDDLVQGNDVVAGGGEGIAVRDQDVGGNYHALRETIDSNVVNGATVCIGVGNIGVVAADNNLAGNTVRNCTQTGISIGSGADDSSVSGGLVDTVSAATGANAGVGVNADGTLVSAVKITNVPGVPGIEIFGGTGSVVEGVQIDAATVPTPLVDNGAQSTVSGAWIGGDGAFGSLHGFTTGSTLAPQFTCTVSGGSECGLELDQAGVASWRIRNLGGSGNLALSAGGTNWLQVNPITGLANLAGGLAIGGGAALASSDQQRGAGTVNPNDLVVNSAMPLAAQSASFAPGSLAPGTCATQAPTPVPGLTTTMAVVMTPRTDPGPGVAWFAILTTGAVAVRECDIGATAVTPAAAAFNIRAIQ